MKKEIVFKCENELHLKHVVSMISQLVSLSRDRSGEEHKLYTMMNIILLIAEWSDDPDLIPVDVRHEMEALADRHDKEVQRLRTINYTSSEFNEASMNMAKEQAPYVSRFFDNASIYPCLVTAIVDDSQNPGSRIKIAVQTAKSAGKDVLDKVDRIFNGVPDLWDAIFVCEPYVFMKMLCIYLRDPGTYSAELYASLGTILANKTKPVDLSDRMYVMVYIPFILEAHRECRKHVMKFMNGMLGMVSAVLNEEQDDNDDDKED